MGLDYASVHLQFTIPLAGVLTIAAKPFLTRLDAVRIAFITTVAFTATLPWDSRLIRSGVWTYPPDSVLGPTLLSIPIEELFFFVIQTYITALLYIMLSKPLLLAQYLNTPKTRPSWIRRGTIAGQVFLAALTALGGHLLLSGGAGTYAGYILFWACPFLLLTWSISGDLLLAMPWASTVLPILLPTFFLWHVDNIYLGNGTWAIESGTKFNKQLFGSLEVEEALFFLITNTLIVFGVAAFDQAVAVCELHPELFPEPADSLPIISLLRARILPSSRYDEQRILGLREAVSRLKRKSRSFFLASFVFPGRVRIDLTLLYSYCRVADDLVDDAPSSKEALHWVSKLKMHLDAAYGESSSRVTENMIKDNFPPSTHSALELLPTFNLSKSALYELLEGFRTDLEFAPSSDGPIRDESDLELYASRVASTVGELCLDLILHHNGSAVDKEQQEKLYAAAKSMGIALQYVNIARDVSVDADMGRVYLPTTWLREQGLMSSKAVLENPSSPQVELLRHRLLDKAMERYSGSRGVMELLPRAARGPMVVAVENYMEIGRVLAEGGLRVEGKATVPKWRRISVAWRALMTS